MKNENEEESSEFSKFEQLSTTDKWDAILELIQLVTFVFFSVTTVVLLGFDCNTAYFFLMTTNKLSNLGFKTSKTLGSLNVQFGLYLTMTLYALTLGLLGTAKIDKDADNIDSLIYLIQAAQYLFLGISAFLRGEVEKDLKEKLVSILTDLLTFLLYGYEFFRDDYDLQIIYSGGPETNFQKVLIISYCV
jgi:hypothetical protein